MKKSTFFSYIVVFNLQGALLQGSIRTLFCTHPGWDTCLNTECCGGPKVISIHYFNNLEKLKVTASVDGSSRFRGNLKHVLNA